MKNSATGMVTPAAKPSIPSVIFTAFTVPTITNAANTMYSGQGIKKVTWKKGT